MAFVPVPVSQLPVAQSVSTADTLVISQNGVTKQATAGQFPGITPSGVAPGSYGDASHVPAYTVDETGRLTAAEDVAITPAAIGAAPAANPTFTGVVTVPLGSAGAPSIARTADPTTGIFFRPDEGTSITSGGTEAFRVDDLRRTLVGTAMDQAIKLPAALQVAGDGNEASAVVARFSSNVAPAALYLSKARGTTGSPQNVENGDRIGAVVFSPQVPNAPYSYVNGVTIIGRVNGTPVGEFVPTSVSFSVSSTSEFALERLRLTDSAVTLGGTPGAESLKVNNVPGADAALEVSGGIVGSSDAAVTTSAGNLSITSAAGHVLIPNLVDAADDAAAAAAGVPVNGLYRNGSVVMVRVS